MQCRRNEVLFNILTLDYSYDTATLKFGERSVVEGAINRFFHLPQPVGYRRWWEMGDVPMRCQHSQACNGISVHWPDYSFHVRVLLINHSLSEAYLRIAATTKTAVLKFNIWSSTKAKNYDLRGKTNYHRQWLKKGSLGTALSFVWTFTNSTTFWTVRCFI